MPENFRSGLVALAVVFIAALIQVLLLGGAMNVAQGDHGKDILIAAEILEGKLPLRHYPFAYGPLGPYVLAGAFVIFGVSVLTARIVWCVFYLASVVVFFLALRRRVGDFPAACAAAALSLFTWFNLYTFYHQIAVFLFMLVLLAWLGDMPRAPGLQGRLIAFGVFLGLFTVTKPNMGIAMAAGVIAVGVLGVFQRKADLSETVKRYGTAVGIAVVIALIVYIPHLSGGGPGLSGAAGGLRVQPENAAVQMLKHFGNFLKNPKTLPTLVMSNPSQLTFTLVLGIALMVFLLIRNGWKGPEFALLACGMVISVLGAHEFFIIGTYWSLHTWALPGMALVWAAALVIFLPQLKNFPASPGKAGLVVSTAIFLVLLGLLLARVGREKKTVYADHPRMKVSIYDGAWWDVVSAGAKFITDNTEQDEKIFCAIDDSLYYVLSGREPASRYLRLDEISRIDDSKQKEIISDLEKYDCRLLLVSNRSFNSKVAGVGVLGKTHGKILWKHITDNYVPVGTFGPWEKASEQIKNHAVKFYWKKDRPFPPGK